jgi:hypothetical protein
MNPDVFYTNFIFTLTIIILFISVFLFINSKDEKTLKKTYVRDENIINSINHTINNHKNKKTLKKIELKDQINQGMGSITFENTFYDLIIILHCNNTQNNTPILYTDIINKFPNSLLFSTNNNILNDIKSIANIFNTKTVFISFSKFDDIPTKSEIIDIIQHNNGGVVTINQNIHGFIPDYV